MQAVCLEAITAKSLLAAKAALLHLHEKTVQGGVAGSHGSTCPAPCSHGSEQVALDLTVTT